MDSAIETQIRELAEPLWQSAARPYGMAMDFWLMAEQMVVEMVAATARLQKAALTEPPRTYGLLPEAAPVAQIRALAECMWNAAGQQYGMTQDFWLAAERHVLAMMRATAAPMRDGTAAWAEDLARLSPAAYLERIQVVAYYLWEAAGQQYGRALDFWLEAERRTLSALQSQAAAKDLPGEFTGPANNNA
jgi:hypothetical protein